MARIAVMIRDRQAEALRMSIGLTTVHDTVDIFLLEQLVPDDNARAQLEAARDLDMKVFSTVPGSDFEQISAGQLADKLLEYDKVLPY